MKDKKNILICIPSFTYGGAENHSFMIAKALKDTTRYNVKMFSFSDKKDSVSMYDAAGIPYVNYPNVITIGEPFFIKLTKAVKLILFLRKNKTDIIIASTFNVNFSMLITWKFSGVKKFFWRQAGIDEVIPLSKLERWNLSSSIHYLCNSTWVQEYVTKRHQLNEASPIDVIRNAVFKRNVIKTREQWREELNIETDTIVLTMTANYFPEKDFITLLKAYQHIVKSKLVRKTKLILAGNAPGNSSAKNEIKALAFDLKLQDNVIFLESTNDVFGLYHASDIGVLSTLSEGFSNSLIEYMYCGLPIVSTNIPPNIEAIPKESLDCLFEPKNIEDCASKLLMLIEAEGLRKELGEENEKWAKAQYSEERFIADYKNLFEKIEV